MKLWLRKYWFEVTLGTAGCFVVALGVGGLVLGSHLGPSEGRAQIGDFVGGTSTPILTALTFIGVLVGIALQRRELIATREELKETKRETARSATALQQQVASLERQRLSQAFFDLFGMYNSVVSSIETGPPDNRRVGKSALQSFAIRYLPHSFSGRSAWSIEDVKDTHDDQNDELGSYFRMIFRMLSFLAKEGEQGSFFADIFRAQLTTSELHLLLYNCISDVGHPMEEFAAEFELFDNMPIPMGANFEVLLKDMNPKCFGENSALVEMHAL